MKILQTIAGFGTHSGGTSTCTYELLQTLHRIGCNVDLMTLQSDDLMGKGEAWIIPMDDDHIGRYGYSHNINRFLARSEYDVYHTNGMWMHVNHATCTIARKKKRPYIITPHGMLYPEALKRSYWKKWPLKKLWFDKDIRNATCMHATCHQEYNHLRNYGYLGPIAIIPNPVGIPEYINEIFTNRNYQECDDKRIIGFLGRLHPRKKVENILYGLSYSKCQNVNVLIIGKGDDTYEMFLRNEVKRLGLSERVKFVGFVNGVNKFESLATLSALFVPSDFENFGMIVPEALLVGTPVMASLGTPWEELNTHHCGWWRDGAPEEIAQVIQLISNIPTIELKQMGLLGRNLIIDQYSADKVAGMMMQLYLWILGKQEKPEFVYD